jgi:hypothetical protein
MDNAKRKSGSKAKDGKKSKKTCVTMGNIWELCLTGSEHDRLVKAFSDHCKEKNIAPQDFF